MKPRVNTKVAGSILPGIVFYTFMNVIERYYKFLVKTWYWDFSKKCKNRIRRIQANCQVSAGCDLRTFRTLEQHENHYDIFLMRFTCTWAVSLGYLSQERIIDQNDSFRYFRLLMSTWSDSICENTFETSHVLFIHENFSVLITTPLDQIQQNLLRKKTCQPTANPADIVLQTWFEEYPTPP